MGKLIVKVHGCRDLKGTDLLSKADCYVKVTVGSKSFRTKTIDNDENPNYNEAFSYFLSDAAIDESIKLELFDAGTFSDDLLGNLYIPIKTLHPNQENALTLKWEKAAGTLICKIHPELSDAVSAQMTGSVANNHGSAAPNGGSMYPQGDNNYAHPGAQQAPPPQHQQQQQQQQQYMPTGGVFGSNSSLSGSSGQLPGSPYGGANNTTGFAPPPGGYANPYSGSGSSGSGSAGGGNPYGNANPYGGSGSNNSNSGGGGGYNYPQAGGFTNSAYGSVGHTHNQPQPPTTMGGYGQPQQNNNSSSTANSAYPGYPGGSSYPGAGGGGGSAYPGYPGYK